MEPRIQYAQTSDGVSIAFCTLGEGAPLVQMPVPPWGHLELGWQMPEFRRWYERLAERRMLVWYDGRGSGLSDRDVAGVSIDTQVLDLEAVVEHVALDRFALLGVIHSGPAAITYAVRRPERVSHLVLWCTYARASDYNASPQAQALDALMDHDWELYTETVAHARLGWSAGHSARQFAEWMRESTTPEAAQAAFAAINKCDVAALLPQVRSPTLVLHRRQLPFPDVGVARGLASRIPDARLALLEGESVTPFLGDTEAVLRAIDEFLGEGEKGTAQAEPAAPGGLVTILFTDMESSTALTQRLGDAKAQQLLRAHNAIVRDALKAHAGSEIKHTGDGIMASFPTASTALDCAAAIQRAVFAHGEEHPDSPLAVHVGLNAGEPIAEDQDLFGTSVQLARRICDQAQGGEILASNVVRELAAGKGFLFSDRGDVALRGFEDPMRLFELRWREP